MKAKTHLTLWTLLVLGAFLLAGCNDEGLAAFSPENDYVALITRERHLYTTSMDGGQVAQVESNEILYSFDVSFDPLGDRLLYAINGGVCTAGPTGANRTCPLVTLPSGVNSGFLSFIPNGQFILAFQSGTAWELRVYNQNGSQDTSRSRSGIDFFALTANAYKVKRGSEGTQWYLTPYRSGEQDMRWVIVEGGLAYLYTASNRLNGPNALGEVNANTLSLMTNRVVQDITSAVVSPDGTKIVFRNKGADERYNLYLVDLSEDNSPHVTLVSQAEFRIQFAFSPDSGELVYESNAGGRSIWVASADGSNQRKLADNASLPTWY